MLLIVLLLVQSRVFQVQVKTPRVLIGTGLTSANCIDCGICIQVCPVEEAIIPEARPDLQKTAL